MKKSSICHRCSLLSALRTNEVKVYTGELIVWVPETGKSTFYDITHINFSRKVRDTTNVADSTGPRFENEETPHQLPAADNNIPQNPENASDTDNDLRFSVEDVRTGSAADYGTGEGAQVYGRGLCGSSSRGVAEWYANNDAHEKNKEQILLDGKPFNYAASGGGFENLVAFDVLLDVRRHAASSCIYGKNVLYYMLQ